MSDDALATVLLLRNAAAHAGQIKRELAAIIQVCHSCLKGAFNLTCNASCLPTIACLSLQSSGSVQSEWVSQVLGLSDPAARVCFGKALLLFSKQSQVMQNRRANCRCCKEVCHRIMGSCESPASQICLRSLVRYGAQLLLSK